MPSGPPWSGEGGDSGALRQATGPPWSGARVGVGMLRGAGDSLT